MSGRMVQFATRWEDASSYSRNETERTPKVWQAKAGRLRVSVHRHIGWPPEQWLISCEPWFDKFEARSTDVEEAKREAIERVTGELTRAAALLRTLIEDPPARTPEGTT